MNEQEFIDTVKKGCYFIRFKPLTEDLKVIYKELLRDCSTEITFDSFVIFLKDCFDLPTPPIEPCIPIDHKCKEQALIKDFQLALWTELRRRYRLILKGYNRNYITRYEMEEWFRTVLGYSLGRVTTSFALNIYDKNHDCRITED
jgi:hypothetical protein